MEVLAEKALGFVIHEDWMVRFQNQVCVSTIEELKRKILEDGHNTPYSFYPNGNKLYKDLKRTFW